MKKLSLACLIAAVLAPSFASAHKAGDFIVRGGTATVRPNESSDKVAGIGSLNVDNNTQFGLTVGYMVTDNIGIELLAATPFKHRIGLDGFGNIGEVKQLPPTLMAQWYFDTPDKSLFPYVGIGVNYTNFFSGTFNSQAKNSLNTHDLKLDHSWGVAVQAGLDYNLTEEWLINASVWWMNIETQARFKTGTEDITRHKIDTRLDPFVFMFGVGYRF